MNNATPGHKIQLLQKLELTWDEFLQGYALPNTHHRVDPLNQQREIRWKPTDIPERRGPFNDFPKMRINIMELASSYQQELREPYGIYLESILTTQVITKKFGQAYLQLDSSQHGAGS